MPLIIKTSVKFRNFGSYIFARFRRITFRLDKFPNVKELPSEVLTDFRQMISDLHQNFQLNHGRVYSPVVECKLRLLMLIANDFTSPGCHFLLFDFYIKTLSNLQIYT